MNHGFLRDPYGKITRFDVPGAGTGSGQGTLGLNNNPEGAIVGWYVDTNNADHGYVRDPYGRIATFDCPIAGTRSGQGTMPIANSAAGTSTDTA